MSICQDICGTNFERNFMDYIAIVDKLVQLKIVWFVGEFSPISSAKDKSGFEQARVDFHWSMRKNHSRTGCSSSCRIGLFFRMPKKPLIWGTQSRGMNYEKFKIDRYSWTNAVKDNKIRNFRSSN